MGVAQAILMVAGFLLVVGYFLWFFLCAARYLSGAIDSEPAWRAQYRQAAWAWQSGVILCALAWGWALISTLSFLKEPPASSPANGSACPLKEI